MTEKLFEAMKYNVVPVVLGKINIENPKQIIISILISKNNSNLEMSLKI